MLRVGEDLPALQAFFALHTWMPHSSKFILIFENYVRLPPLNPENFESVMALRQRVNIKLEEARKLKLIGRPEDAWVDIVNRDKSTLFMSGESLRELLKVSELWLTRDVGGGEEAITVSKCVDHGYVHCPRCRLFHEPGDPRYFRDNLCLRCTNILAA